MALFQLNSLAKCSFQTLSLPKQFPLGTRAPNKVSFTNVNAAQNFDAPTQRRSANWKPSTWDHDFIGILHTAIKYTSWPVSGEVYVKRADSLKDEIRHFLINLQGDAKSPLEVLELIDDIQRLGLEHIFQDDIHRALGFVKESNNAAEMNIISMLQLFSFGYLDRKVSVYPKDRQGNFMEHLIQDVKGLISLYEASYFGMEGENILDEAKAFAWKHLKDIKGNIDPNLKELVNHSLDLPLNYRINRLEARWYIDAYSRTQSPNNNLLELAKLDYNMVQSAHQKDAHYYKIGQR